MAFDQSTRNRLQKFVADARHVLTEEFTRQMQNDYGLDPRNGTIAALDELRNLDDTKRETARILRETVEHYHSLTPNAETADLLERIVREQAFTVLNRLAALRMAEARGFLIESLGGGFSSKGFQLYSRVAKTGLGETGDVYRTYLFSLFDEFSLDLKVLFDRFSPFGRLFPREKALLDLLALINHHEIESLWAEDETVGWIYQYFNSKDERKKMRDESAAPRNSRELAVRNQFFTPRYVVEFLTDNTLGRIWYEMTNGETSLVEKCRYLVKTKDEVGTPNDDSILNPKSKIQNRALKDPREILMLDPACGSMHFGLYAFDLFLTIYEEAWEMSEQFAAANGAKTKLKSLRDTYENDKAKFLRDVPRLIIENNIHGVDIDPRAVQIAGLSLWLRAQRAWSEQNVKPLDRPQIRRSNIVCAEPMPGEADLLEEFVTKHFSETPEKRLLGEFVRRIFDSMRLAGEAGSLLKIEEEAANLIAEAREQWRKLQETDKETPFLFEGARTNVQAGFNFEVGEITDAQFWDRAESEIYKALRRYSEANEDGAGYSRRLFADDAAQGFAFIDLCRKKFDCVLMNPPFGLSQGDLYKYLSTNYEDSFIDLLASFVVRGKQLSPNGFVGAITSRACLYTKTLLEWRAKHLSGKINALADLGIGVLDGAMVRACAYVLSSSDKKIEGCFVNARTVDEKADYIQRSLTSLNENLYFRDSDFFNLIPQKRILYSLPLKFWQTIKSLPAIEPDFATIRAGLTTYDDTRFLRLKWEVNLSEFGTDKKWISLSKGGYYGTFYNDIHLVVLWESDGKEVGAFNSMLYDTSAQSRRGSSFYYKSAATYSRRTDYFSARVLPPNCLFADKGPAIIPIKNTSEKYLLGLFNSDLFRGLVHSQSQGGCFETGVLKILLWANPNNETKKEVEKFVDEIWQIKAQVFGNFENDSWFVSPWIFTSLSLQESFDKITELLNNSNNRTTRIAKENSRIISEFYKLPSNDFEDLDIYEDDHEIKEIESISALSNYIEILASYFLGCAFGRWDLRYAIGEKTAPELPDPFAPLPVCPPGMLQNAEGLPVSPNDLRTTNYELQISWDGILVDDAGHKEDVENRLRSILGLIFKDRAEAVETEACAGLGVKSLRDYFRKPAGFFADHLKRYSKSRRQAPIYLPLSTRSGEYTLWLYYHRLTDQTLYTCVNDYVEPKLKSVQAELSILHSKPARTSDDEKRFEKQQTFAYELEEMQNELLRLAAIWKPNLNDGVQITMSPLWKLFNLAKWQKTLKETWQKLEKGDYDWAHLAYSLFPERVSEKCVKDKSLAIAHDLEDLYIEPPAKIKKKSGAKKADQTALEGLSE